MPKFEENALYVGGKCSKKLAMLKKILMLFMSENAKNYAGLFYRWLPTAILVHAIALHVYFCPRPRTRCCNTTCTCACTCMHGANLTLSGIISMNMCARRTRPEKVRTCTCTYISEIFIAFLEVSCGPRDRKSGKAMAVAVVAAATAM